MGAVNFSKVDFFQLKRISVLGGDVLHGLKASDPNFKGFGEAYFSIAQKGYVKAWKLHKNMTMALIVPKGSVQFVFYDERSNDFHEYIIGDNNFGRLTVSPGVWFGFRGVGEGDNLILNIANIEHSPDEVDRREVNQMDYKWS